MKRNYKKSILVLSIVFLFSILGTACGSKAENKNEPAKKLEKLKIGYFPILHALPLITSSVWDANSDVKVELVKYSSWPELNDAVNTGKLDGAVMLLPLAMASKSKGMPITTVALSHKNGDSIIVNKSINSAKDLIGKKIAIPHRFSGHNLLAHMFLEKNGIDASQVTFIEYAPADMIPALQRGEIDAFTAADPFCATAVANNIGKELIKANEIWPNWIGNGLVLRDEIIKNYPKEVQTFVNNFVNAGLKIEQNKKAAIDAVKDKFSAKPELLEASVKYENFNDLNLKEEDFKKLQDTMLKLKLIDKEVDLSKFLNNSFVEKAYKEGKK